MFLKIVYIKSGELYLDFRLNTLQHNLNLVKNSHRTGPQERKTTREEDNMYS